MSADLSLESEIQSLRAQSAWAELDALYENLSKGTSHLEQRLFYDWERSTLLVEHLDRPLEGVQVLWGALLAGGPPLVIAQQIESVRLSLTQRDEINQSRREEVNRVIYDLFCTLLDKNPDIEELKTILHWVTLQRHQASSIEAPSINSAEEPILAAPPQGPKTPPPFTAPPRLPPKPPSILLQPQDTLLSQELPDQALLNVLRTPNIEVDHPMSFMVDLEGLCTLRSLNFDEQMEFEPLLWRAAERKSQWRKWAQIFGQFFASNAPTIEIATQRTFQLASIHELKLREEPTAVDLYEDVLGYDPTHPEAFERLRALLRQQKRWKQLIDCLKTYARATTHKEERFDLYLEVGDLYRDQIKSPAKAVTAWFESLEISPDSRQILMRLLEIYQQMERWTASVKVLKKIIKLEEDPAKRAYYTYTIGLIYKDQLNDPYLAVRAFDEALDDDPQFLKAFQAIDDLLDETRDTARRDRYYRKMLIRAVNHELDPNLIAELALQIGHLNLIRLNQIEEAQRAYDLVLNYRPMDEEGHRGSIAVKRKLFGLEAATEQAFQWVRRTPTSADAYRALYRCTAEAGHLDWAWCVASALQVLNSSTEESAHFFQEGLSYVGSRIQRPLTETELKLLTWSGQNKLWSTVIALSTPALSAQLAVKPKSVGVHPKRDRLNGEPTTTFGRVLQYITETFHLQCPVLWAYTPPNQSTVTPLIFDDLGLGISESIIASQSIENMVIHLTYGLYISQPDTWLASLSPLDDNQRRLSRLNEAFQAIYSGQASKDSSLTSWVNALSTLPREHLNQIRQMGALTEGADWIRAIEQTAYRSALLLSGHLRGVVDLMRHTPPISDDSFETRLYKLLLFAVSPPYIEIRQSLDLAIKSQS